MYFFICSDFLSFPLSFFYFLDSGFLDGKEIQGHPIKCLIRSLQLLCNISPGGPSASACTPPRNGGLIPLLGSPFHLYTALEVKMF